MLRTNLKLFKKVYFAFQHTVITRCVGYKAEQIIFVRCYTSKWHVLEGSKKKHLQSRIVTNELRRYTKSVNVNFAKESLEVSNTRKVKINTVQGISKVEQLVKRSYHLNKNKKDS